MTVALGTYGDSPTPPDRQRRRDDRHRLKTAQRAITATVSSRLCWYASAGGVVVDIGASLTAHVTGVRRCASPWACMLCAPVIRERRAGEIDTGVSVHLDRGGSGLFVTFALRHHRADELGPRLATVTQALSLTLKGSGWDRRRARLGYVGAIKAVEITDGRNGWHPHAHCLLLFDRPLSDAEVGDLYRWLFARWSRVVVERGFGTINRHGLDARRVTTADDLSSYLTKLEGGWGVGLELTRSDRKKGLSPWSHLRTFAETGDVASARRWLEYEDATYGKRSLRWSAGLRARLLGNDDAPTDADLAASEGADLTLMRAVLMPTDWNPAIAAGAGGSLLTELERVAAVLLAMTTNPQPLEVPRVVPR